METNWKFSNFQRASRSLAKTCFFLVFFWFFFQRCFSSSFWSPFCRVLDRFWALCWAYVGSFFELFSLLSWGLILKSFFHRFFIEVGHPWNLKKWAPVQARIKKSIFYISHLKLTLGAHFGPQKAAKIDPKRLRNRFKNYIKIWLKLNADFDPNLTQLGGQLGPKLGPKRLQKRSKKGT